MQGKIGKLLRHNPIFTAAKSNEYNDIASGTASNLPVSYSFIKKGEGNMKFKKVIAAVLTCGLIAVSLATVPKAVSAADAASAFNGVILAKGYKPTTWHNPCLTTRYNADPGVMEYNGRVYIYTSNDGDISDGYSVTSNSYAKINKINCMSSSDMVNWTDHGSIAAAGSSGAAKWAGCSWAPTACHKTINGKEKFFLYFANNANGIGVLTADSPTGPWKDPIGKALVSRSTANCASVTWLFDPAVIVDSDGTGYLYFRGGVPDGQSANPKTARVVKLGSDMTSLAGTPVTIDAPYIFEDSGINKVGNTYYYSYCSNWSGGYPGTACICYMTSSSPTGPFTYKGQIFKNPGTFFGTTGNNHHTLFQFKNKWYIAYHSEWLNKQIYGSQKGFRSTQIDNLTFNNGFSAATGTLAGVSQTQNLNPYTTQRAANMAWEGGVTVSGSGVDTTAVMDKGDWLGVSNVEFSSDSTQISIKAASTSGAVIKVCAGSQTGTVLGYVTIPATGSNSTFKTVTGTLNGTSGTKNLFFAASNGCVLDSWYCGAGTPSSSPTASITTEKVTDGWYYLKNMNAQKYLQVKDNKGANIQNVEISTGTGQAGQKWYVTNTSDGYVTLTSGLGNYMLDIANGADEDGANVQIYSGYSGNAQKYQLAKTSTNNVYCLLTKASNGTKAIDVYNFGKTDGTNVCQWTYTGATNQQWVLEKINTASSPSASTAPSTTPSPSAATGGSTTAGLPNGISCEYSVVSDWGSNFQGQIVLTNNSTKIYNGWTLSFDYASTINSLWGAELISQTGKKVIVNNASWDTALAPGSSVTINFTAAGTGNDVPTGYSFQ